ncbi:MAG: hypothetical protein AB7T38_00735 [Nitrospirales bacterium]
MNDSIFSLFALPAPGQSPVQDVDEHLIPGSIATEDSSFFDLFQRHTSAVSVREAATDVPSVIQNQANFGVQTLPLSQESLAVLDPEQSGKTRHRDVDTITLSDLRFLHLGEDDESPVVFGSGEFTYTPGYRVVDGESHPYVGQEGFIKGSEPVLSFESNSQSRPTHVPLPVADPRPSYGVGSVGFGQTAPQTVAHTASHTAPQTAELPILPVLEHGKMNTSVLSSAQEALPVKGLKIQEPGKLQESVGISSPEGSKGQDKIPMSDSGIDDLPEKSVDLSPRRSIIKFDPPSLPDPQRSNSMLPRSVATVESSVPLPTPPNPATVQPQSVSGGSAIRPDAVGAAIGGTVSIVTESLSETGGSKQDLTRVQGIGDTYGANSDANEESGVHSGLGGFSHSQSGHQFSHSQSGQLAGGGIRVPEEAAPVLPPQPIQRLQLDVQISETQRVQIDVGVQHRQVYAGLVMDQMALRNLALQFVPQLEEQFTNINMELSKFSAETQEEKGSAADSAFQGRKSPSETQEGMGGGEGGFSGHRGTLHRPISTVETGLHFVA